jgi:hypothetical protein
MSKPLGVMPRRNRLSGACSETSGLFKTPDISEQWVYRGRTRPQFLGGPSSRGRHVSTRPSSRLLLLNTLLVPALPEVPFSL